MSDDQSYLSRKYAREIIFIASFLLLFFAHNPAFSQENIGVDIEEYFITRPFDIDQEAWKTLLDGGELQLPREQLGVSPEATLKFRSRPPNGSTIETVSCVLVCKTDANGKEVCTYECFNKLEID